MTKIYAEMIGGGMSADAYHMTAPHPDGFGAALVMRAALSDAGLTPADIDYVNVHGTSNPDRRSAGNKSNTGLFWRRLFIVINVSSNKIHDGAPFGRCRSS